MSTISYLIETLKKLYEDDSCPDIDLEKIQQLFEAGKISEHERDYIIKGAG